MRDAGKVAMTPRGIYNEETTYEYLDIVLYGMSSWVAKKVTTGNPPEEGEYWQKIAAGTEEIINDSIVSGGNAWSSLKTNNLYKEQGLDFIVSSTRENIQTGETHQRILGKVKRWFSDLKTVAFSGNYNDLSNKPTLGNSASKAVANNVTTTGEGSVLDARQGKVLKDEINQLNSNFGAEALSASFDANDIIGDASGTDKIFRYYNAVGAGSQNVPQKTGGLLRVIRQGTYIRQFVYGLNTIYYRTGVSDGEDGKPAFQAWKNLTPMPDSDLNKLLRVVELSANYTLSANGAQAISIPYTLPDGYSFVAAVGFRTGDVSIYAIGVDGNRIDLKNTSATTITGTVKIKVLYAKSFVV